MWNLMSETHQKCSTKVQIVTFFAFQWRIITIDEYIIYRFNSIYNQKIWAGWYSVRVVLRWWRAKSSSKILVQILICWFCCALESRRTCWFHENSWNSVERSSDLYFIWVTEFQLTECVGYERRESLTKNLVFMVCTVCRYP